MKRIVYLVVIGVLMFQSLNGNDYIVQKEDYHKKIVYINGEQINYIYQAFNDYKKSKIDPFTKIRYYNFLIDENIHEVIIDISYNHELVKKELKHFFKGGGARYTLDKSDLSIKSKIFYK